jgi:hypothetical protein
MRRPILLLLLLAALPPAASARPTQPAIGGGTTLMIGSLGLNTAAPVNPGSLALGGTLSSTTTQAQQFVSHGNFGGSVTSGQAFFNQFAVDSDSVNTTGTGGPGGADWLYVGGTMNSASITGNRTALVSFLNLTAATGNGAGNGAFYTGFGTQSQASANDGGTNTVGAGNLFGINPVAILQSGGTYFNSLVGGEVDVAAQSGSTKVYYKTGLKIVQLQSDSVQGTTADYAIGLNNQASGTAPGWNVGFAFGGPEGWWPIKSTGTMLGTYAATVGGGPSMSAAYGIDFSAVTFSSGFLKSTGFLVDGSGNVTANAVNKVAITAPASSATLTIANGKTLTVNNSITFSGTDATTMTLPTTSKTLMASDYSNASATTLGSTSLTMGGTTSSISGLTLSGATAVTGASLPTQAAGTLGIAGNATKPTLAANGEGDIFLDGTTGGLALIGQGSTNDFEVYNKNGSLALSVPTGTTNVIDAGTFATGGNIIIPNNTSYQAKDSGGTIRTLLYVDNTNFSNIVDAGNAGIRFWNQGVTTEYGRFNTSGGLSIGSTSDAGAGNLLAKGGLFNGTTLGTPAAGTLLLGGSATAPTLGANGEGANYLSAAGGHLVQGQGSTDDVRLLNKSGSTVANIPTGTTNFNVAGGLYDQGTAPTGTAGSGYVRATSPTLATATLGSGSTLTDTINQEFAVSTAAVSWTSNTTLANVTGLAIALTAGKTYNCYGHLTVTASGASGGIQASLVASGGLTATSASFTAANFNGATTNARTTATALGSAIGGATAVSTDVQIDGAIVVNAGGTLNVQAAQNASNITTTTVGQNSTFRCVRVN